MARVVLQSPSNRSAMSVPQALTAIFASVLICVCGVWDVFLPSAFDEEYSVTKQPSFHHCPERGFPVLIDALENSAGQLQNPVSPRHDVSTV